MIKSRKIQFLNKLRFSEKPTRCSLSYKVVKNYTLRIKVYLSYKILVFIRVTT